jgi:hypothetical protein
MQHEEIGGGLLPEFPVGGSFNWPAASQTAPLAKSAAKAI